MSFSRLRAAMRSPLSLMVSVGTVSLAALLAPGCGSRSGTIIPPTPTPPSGLPNAAATLEQVTRGRYIVTTSGCADCHSQSGADPASPNWLRGFVPGTPGQPFQIGPFQSFPANLTSDTTGLGRFTARQVYNALKFGLDPESTNSVVITGVTPGQGNFPANPRYLAPPMPWIATRHLTDDDLWAVVAYLKHGTKPVSNTVQNSDAPPDGWASAYTPQAVGPHVLPTFPAANEQFTP